MCYTVHYTLWRLSRLYEIGILTVELLSFIITDTFGMSQISVHCGKISDINGLTVAKIDCKCLTSSMDPPSSSSSGDVLYNISIAALNRIAVIAVTHIPHSSILLLGATPALHPPYEWRKHSETTGPGLGMPSHMRKINDQARAVRLRF